MTKLCLKVGIAVATVGLVACVSFKPEGAVMPQVDGSYNLLSMGRSESEALRVAQNDAKGTCRDDGKSKFFVLNQQTHYVGPNLEASTNRGAALRLLQIAASNENKENYKVEMHIQCQ
ncbi:MAG: hypothetical protein KUG82_13835 [Pseudomonadales bacterium]|nr:hypothetical protein [Pseudomonadales bacterium]